MMIKTIRPGKSDRLFIIVTIIIIDDIKSNEFIQNYKAIYIYFRDDLHTLIIRGRFFSLKLDYLFRTL